MYGLTVTTPPTVEPVSLAQAKRHLRIDHDTEDLNIVSAIVAARQLCETHSGRFFLRQTVTLKLGGWSYDGVLRLTMFGPNEITAIAAFTYLDSAGVSQTLSPTLYQTEFTSSPPEISIAPLTIWPLLEIGRRFPVTIQLTVGKLTAAELDSRIGQAMLLCLGYWDADRGDSDMATNAGSLGLPAGAKRLLDSIWTGAYVC